MRWSDGGGENALIEKYPYQVSLEYKGHHVCGGSIINNVTVLTAAHCVDNIAPIDLMVRAGSSLVEQRGNMYQVANKTVHENFTKVDQAYLYDVALLLLEDEIVFDDKRKDIRLFLKNQEPSVGDVAQVTGWGLSANQQPQLHVVNVSVVNRTVCDEAYNKVVQGVTDHICAGDTGKGSCWGDDGGPLAIQGKLAGIVSWGDACDKSTNPGVYTSIGFVREWIDNNLPGF